MSPPPLTTAKWPPPVLQHSDDGILSVGAFFSFISLREGYTPWSWHTDIN